MYKRIFRPFLFLFPAETAHHIAMRLFSLLAAVPGMFFILRRIYGVPVNESTPVKTCGLTFRHPVGLAAGFDKDGKYIHALQALGFAFIEVGTVTPRPQQGNPKPRLFRLTKSSGLINRMGFNNDGCDALVKRLERVKSSDVVIGANIGKNKDTPNELAADDYLRCFVTLHAHVDYFVVNVSSPNTPNLRGLQEKKPLMELLTSLQMHNNQHNEAKPIFLKIAPDLTEGQLDDILEIVEATGIAGLVATNTTVSREGLYETSECITRIGAGGLSGIPLEQRATDIVRYLSEKSNYSIPIIGVGGIFTAKDAREKLEAGASLVQVYTGFIYEGPGMVRKIMRGLRSG